MTAPALVGTGRLVRLILRRDRVRLALWFVGLVTLMGVSAWSVADLYDDPARLASYVRTMDDNPALVLFAGPGYGFDRPTIGAVLVNETSLWMALGCGLMSVFLVVRHTRAEEESERADLVRSLVVGRHAATAAALAVAVAVNAAVAAACAVVTLAAGYPATGTLALCASFGLSGVAFAGVAAAAAQVVGTARAALGLGVGVMALAFLVRGLGDIAAPAASWTTPFGWAIGVRAFAGERWWALAGPLAFAVGGAVLAAGLSVRRDLGSGLVTPHGGRGGAAHWATTPLGLTFRLQRASLVAWSVGLFLTGLVYGSVGDDVEAMLVDNPDLAEMLARLGGASLTDAFLATALRMLSMMAAGFAVSSALRNRSEEAAGTAESVLATAVSRWRWAGAHLVVTVAGTLVVVAAAGLGTGVGYAGAVGDGGHVVRLLLASLATAPAVLVLVGVATLLFGWAPRAALAAWGALAVVVVIGIFATVLRLPHWLVLVSPLEHVPSVPAAGWEARPLAALSAVAGALVVAGLAGFRRRDLAAS